MYMVLTPLVCVSQTTEALATLVILYAMRTCIYRPLNSTEAHILDHQIKQRCPNIAIDAIRAAFLAFSPPALCVFHSPSLLPIASSYQ